MPSARGVDQIAQGLGGVMSVTGPARHRSVARRHRDLRHRRRARSSRRESSPRCIARDRTGRGQWVHTSLLESMISFMDFQAARWLIDHDVPAQVGNQHPTIVPMGTFPTADGYVNVSAMGDFAGFCSMIGAPEIADDPRFADGESRSSTATSSTRSSASAFRHAQHRRVGRPARRGRCRAGPVLRIDEVFADPQVQHLGMTRTVDDPTRSDRSTCCAPPLTFSERRRPSGAAAPAAGRRTPRGAGRARLRRRRDRRAPRGRRGADEGAQVTTT